MAISIVVAVDSVADPLIAAIRDRMAKIKIGPGLEDGNEMGPLITREHRDRVASYLDIAESEGATVAVDGREHPASARKGFFLGTSLLDRVEPGMSCYEDEIFGPVLSVVRVKTYQEAVDIVNRNRYGNGVAIFTRDGGAARQFQFDVEVGWSASTCRSLSRWLTTASVAGRPHCSETFTCTVLRESGSTLEQKWSPAGWPDPPTSSVNLGFPQVGNAGDLSPVHRSSTWG